MTSPVPAHPAIIVEQVFDGAWEAVRDVRLAALQDAPGAFGASSAREQMFREQHWRMRVRTSPTWLAWLGDRAAVGMVSTIQEPGSPLDDRHVAFLWVAPTARRCGVATRLIAAAAEAAAAQGARTLSLWVGGENVAARALFLRLAFRSTGERLARPIGRGAEERLVLDLGADRPGGSGIVELT